MLHMHEAEPDSHHIIMYDVYNAYHMYNRYHVCAAMSGKRQSLESDGFRVRGLFEPPS